jgi:hypothetical protein
MKARMAMTLTTANNDSISPNRFTFRALTKTTTSVEAATQIQPGVSGNQKPK